VFGRIATAASASGDVPTGGDAAALVVFVKPGVVGINAPGAARSRVSRRRRFGRQAGSGRALPDGLGDRRTLGAARGGDATNNGLLSGSAKTRGSARAFLFGPQAGPLLGSHQPGGQL